MWPGVEIEVLEGAGAVVERERSAAWFAPEVPAAARESLAELIESEAAAGGSAAGIAAGAARLLGEAAASHFALLAQSGSRVAVVTRGPVLVRHEGIVRLRGEGPDDLLHAELVVEGTLEVAGSLGSAAGGGLRLHVDRAAMVAAAATEPPPDEPSPEAPLVDGLECARGHFNRPTARYCALCGIAMVQGSRRVRGRRPPLGVLLLGNRTRPVNGDYVVGSDPNGHPDVAAGRAMALRIDDPELAAAHAKVVVVGWTVEVHDLGSKPGTFVLDPFSGLWSPVAPGKPAVLEPGGRLRLGDTMIEYRAHSLEPHP